MDPGDLSLDEAEQLLNLRTRFGGGRQTQRRRSTSLTAAPRPLLPEPRQQEAAQQSAASSSMEREPTAPVRADAMTQTHPQAFELLRNDPVPVLRIQEVIPEGPYYHVLGREHVHLIRDCWGLRNASRTEPLMMCRCCRENDGRSMYGPMSGSRASGRA